MTLDAQHIDRLLTEARTAADQLDWSKAADLLAAAGPSSFVLDKRVWYLSRAKRYAEALQLLDTLRKRDPDNFRHWYMTASQYYEQQQYGESLKWFEESLKRKPDHLQSNWRMAYALHKSGREAEAAPLAARVLRIWHTLQGEEKQRHARCAARASYLLAVPQIPHHPEDAAALLSQAIDIEPDDIYYRYRLAQALLRMGRRIDALTELRNARKLKPGDLSIELEYAHALYRNGDPEGAVATISRVQPRLTGGFAFKAGRLALEAGASSLGSRLLVAAQRAPGMRANPRLRALMTHAAGESSSTSIPMAPPAAITRAGAGDAPPLPATGRVQIVSPDRHFGFLIDDRDGRRRHFRLDVTLQLRPGDLVLFKPLEAEKGPAATDVRPAKASGGIPAHRPTELPKPTH